MSISFYPLLPGWLILLLLALAATVCVHAGRHRNPGLAPWRHKLLLTLRCASLGLVTLMLFCPGRMIEDRNLEKSHIVFLLDTSASMAAADLPARRTRLDAAVEFLQRHRFKYLADYPFAFYSFNIQTRRHAAPAELSALTAAGGTELQQAVARIDKDIGLNRTAAIILVSDGLDSSGFRGGEIAVPIMSVQAGTDLAAVKDLGIEAFRYPAKVNENEELHLEIPLLLQGYSPEMPVTCRISVNKTPVHSAELKMSSGRIHTEKFTTVLSGAGMHVVSIACSVLPDEVTDLNNQREIAVEVVQAKDEMAAYFPVLNNSFRPLLREFSRGEDTAFTAVYRVAADTYRLRGQKISRAFSNGLPKTAEELKNLSCLILGAHNGEMLTPAETLMLEQYVDRGGTLICLGGADAFGKISAGSPMLRLLPVMPLADSFQDLPFRVETDQFADDAFAKQIRQIIADNQDAPELLLKGINQVQDIKAHARVLLWAAGTTRLPLLVWQNYGRGKVIALLSNAFHLWGSQEKREENFSRFWRQLVAFARNPEDDADLLRIALDKTEIAAGEPVAVTAIAQHPDGRDAALSVKVDVFASTDDTPLQTLTLANKGGSFMGEIAGLPAGRYVLRAVSRDDRELLRVRYKLLLAGDIMKERAVLRTNREVFRRYSADKHIFSLDDAGRLEDMLRQSVRKNLTWREEFMIFESPLFFVLLLLLLLAEWLLRRRFNLF